MLIGRLRTLKLSVGILSRTRRRVRLHSVSRRSSIIGVRELGGRSRTVGESWSIFPSTTRTFKHVFSRDTLPRRGHE